MFNCIKPKIIYPKIKKWKIGKYNRYPVENYYHNKPILVGCNKCEFCRKRYATIWAKRCELETFAQEQLGNYQHYFLTLTFEHKPIITKKKQLKAYCKYLTQNFIKKIRNKQRKQKQKLKYIMCWELGEEKHRLHAHGLLWNLNINDKIPYGMSKSGEPLFISETLNQYWEHGMAWIGDLTPASANYCFSYSAKDFIAKFQSQGIGQTFLDLYEKVILNGQYTNRYFLKKERKKYGEQWYLKKIINDDLQKNEPFFDFEKLEKNIENCKEKLESNNRRIKNNRDY